MSKKWSNKTLDLTFGDLSSQKSPKFYFKSQFIKSVSSFWFIFWLKICIQIGSGIWVITCFHNWFLNRSFCKLNESKPMSNQKYLNTLKYIQYLNESSTKGLVGTFLHFKSLFSNRIIKWCFEFRLKNFLNEPAESEKVIISFLIFAENWSATVQCRANIRCFMISLRHFSQKKQCYMLGVMHEIQLS